MQMCKSQLQRSRQYSTVDRVSRVYCAIGGSSRHEEDFHTMDQRHRSWQQLIEDSGAAGYSSAGVARKT